MIIDKYSRNKFYTYNDINNIREADLVQNKFKDFKFTRGKLSYTVKSNDLQRPDLISYNIFGRVNYWWIIMKINGIEDIWNDLYVGQTLLIPLEADLEDFVLKTRMK